MKPAFRSVSAFEARTHLGEMLDHIRYTHEPCFIERHGKKVAVLLDIGSYEKMSLPDRYRRWVAEAVSKIAEEYKPRKIILFGSASRGEVREGSDIDLLIIKETSDRPLDRTEKVLKSLPLDNPTEPHVYTPKELEKRIQSGDPFLTEALQKGTLLYEA